MRRVVARPVLAALLLVLGSACGSAAPSRAEDSAALALASSLLPREAAASAAAAQPRADAPPVARDRAPARIRGIYVAGYVAASPKRLRELLALADSTEINTFVVDVKDDGGAVLYKSRDTTVREIARRAGARALLGNLRSVVDTLRAHGIYTIARVVVFKDPILSRARPEWSIRTPTGALWRDKAGNTWVSPWDDRVWDYNLAVAEDAARAGFDEIQFDYVRFPEAYASLPRQVHPKANGNRADAIAAFLDRATARLRPLGVSVGADLFGMTMNDPGDVGIGQQWETLSVRADRLYPMVYPSHYFPTHLPGVRAPNRMPYEAVATAVGMGVVRNQRLRAAGARPARTVPWLQAFRAPWVERGRPFPYGPAQAAAQMQAVYDVGLEDWIFWNAASRYDQIAAAFAREPESRAKIYTPPAPVLRQVELFERGGMKQARAAAVRRAGALAARRAASMPAN